MPIRCRSKIVVPAGALTIAIIVFFLGSRMLSRRPADGSPGTGKTMSQITQDQKHEAVFLTEALKKKPDHTPVLLRMAQLSEESGNQLEAARHLREVLRYEPDNADAQLELGRVLFQTGDVQGALKQTLRILDHQPNHADALYNLGAIYANLGNTTLALQYWNRLLAVSPQTESARRARTMMAQLPAEAQAAAEDVSNTGRKAGVQR